VTADLKTLKPEIFDASLGFFHSKLWSLQRQSSKADETFWIFGDDVSDVSLRLDIVQLAGLDDRADGGGALAAGLRPGKQPVLAADRDAAIARSAMCYRSLGDRRRGPA